MKNDNMMYAWRWWEKAPCTGSILTYGRGGVGASGSSACDRGCGFGACYRGSDSSDGPLSRIVAGGGHGCGCGCFGAGGPWTWTCSWNASCGLWIVIGSFWTPSCEPCDRHLPCGLPHPCDRPPSRPRSLWRDLRLLVRPFQLQPRRSYLVGDREEGPEGRVEAAKRPLRQWQLVRLLRRTFSSAISVQYVQDSADQSGDNA